MAKALVYFQSGGPTAVINESLYGVIDEARKHAEIAGIFGSKYGIEGLINDDLVDLDHLNATDLKIVRNMPGAALGSSRKKLPEDFSDPIYASLVTTLQKHHIGYLLVNGGNDSMDTCFRLSQFFKEKAIDVAVIGIPKTIDNDLALTDHSIGYPSAALHIINTMAMIIDDAKAYKKGKIVLVEIMGRDTGWLTASCDLLPEKRRPDLIYIPEMGWNEDEFLAQVQNVYTKKGFAVCAFSEGMPIHHHNDCGVDSFGHHPLEGCCISLGHIIDEKLHISNRTIELSIPTRADPYLRSPIDTKEAVMVSRFAVKALLQGHTAAMVALKRISSNPYRSSCHLVNVQNVADQTVFLPKEYCLDHTRFSEQFRDYLKPLLGEKIVYPALAL